MKLASRLAEDFSVYVHIDKAAEFDVKQFEIDGVLLSYPRRRTYWGSFECTRAILDLLRLARTNNHSHYILLSGQDVPIRSNADIASFFEENSEWDFARNEKIPFSDIGGGIERITRHYWHAYYRYSGAKRKLYQVAEYMQAASFKFLLPEKILVGSFAWGETWFALRKSTVDKVLSFVEENPSFVRIFRGSRLAEEILIPTILRRLDPSVKTLKRMVTHVDWETGPETPRVLDHNDIETVLETGQLFARKVTSEKSGEFLSWAYTR